MSRTIRKISHNVHRALRHISHRKGAWSVLDEIKDEGVPILHCNRLNQIKSECGIIPHPNGDYHIAASSEYINKNYFRQNREKKPHYTKRPG